MGLLSGKEIESALDSDDPEQHLAITPFFRRSLQIDRGAASIDLRLGTRFAAAKRRHHSELSATNRKEHPRKFVDEYFVPYGEKFILHPNHFVLATTLEWIRLPPSLGGYVVGRSTFGRLGLIIATAVGVHPSYSGVLTLEMTNLSGIPISIEPGNPICQLFFHRIKEWDAERVDKSAFLGSLYPRLGRVTPNDIDHFLRQID